jgi:hypothetical protein
MSKRAFLRQARAEFKPGPRRPCAVCGKYEGLVEAHHVYPLGLQYDDGIRLAIHEFFWLCPTHHAVVHLDINAFIKRRITDWRGLPDEDVKPLGEIQARFYAMWTRQQNSKLERSAA